MLGSQSLWFTAPGPDAPVINGLTGRQALPLEDWQILRPALIDRYPDLDMWMAAARQTAQRENLVFPEYRAFLVRHRHHLCHHRHNQQGHQLVLKPLSMPVF